MTLVVTVVTPSFNQGHFIRETVESVLSQDYRDLQYVVIDGGSTDETLSVLQSIRDVRFTWISEKDSGQSDAINKGLRLAKGDILTFINSDDLLLPSAISAAVRYFEQHAEVGAIFGDVQLIESNGDTWGVMKGAPFDLKRALTGGQPVTQQGSFWRRSVMDKIGLFDETLHFTMDLDYWLRIALAGFQLDYRPGLCAAFRRHGASKSMSLQTGFLKDWKTMLTKVYHRTDLPPEIRALKAESDAFVDWGWAKTYWMAQDYAQARPLLKQFMIGKKWSRRLIASAMYMDSYLHTPITRLIAFVFARTTGREILFGENRAI